MVWRASRSATSSAARPRRRSSICDGCGVIGGSRTPSQTARKATPCASPDGPDTITAEALLALASWLDQRDEHGGDPCSPTNRPTCPPPPPPDPLTTIWARLPTDRRRRLQRLLADLLARPVIVAAALPREGAHDHRTA